MSKKLTCDQNYMKNTKLYTKQNWWDLYKYLDVLLYKIKKTKKKIDRV